MVQMLEVVTVAIKIVIANAIDKAQKRNVGTIPAPGYSLATPNTALSLSQR